MHLHILGISGTFMSALAILARASGHIVTGSDAVCYPPISDLLTANGIVWTEGYEDCQQALAADLVIVGNAMKRGMPVIEAMLNARKPYTSGPEWLASQVLPNYRVIAVSGTHGKTTTTAMLAFILQQAGLNPGFLIGGVAADFNTSACLGIGEWFVIEADEYDSAFFDKRPKFMHYHPEVAILNNLEFDHADIYPDLAAIQQQFNYFLRTIPENGLIIRPKYDPALDLVLSRGCWTSVETTTLNNDGSWSAIIADDSGSVFQVWHQGEHVATVAWGLIGKFNVENALAAIAASAHAGVNPQVAARALEQFTPVKRRLEIKYNEHGITLYDDFAHHPTAIRKTIQALKQSGRHKRLFVILEFASYTMRSGVHAMDMAHALDGINGAYILQPTSFSLDDITQSWNFSYNIYTTTDSIIAHIINLLQAGDAVVIMSNRGFENIHERLAQSIASMPKTHMHKVCT